MKNSIVFALSTAAILASQSAYASNPGMFSRSCRFDQIPTIQIKVIANTFFLLAGAPTELASLYERPNDQPFYWIHESITTDYFQVRYYLIAKSQLYVKGNPNYGDPTRFNVAKVYRSNWSVEQIRKEIQNDPKFSPALANRGPTPWYSARAGDPHILVKWWDVSDPDEPVSPELFLVKGRHFYYDPRAGVQVDLGETNSQDCNLTTWGFAIFDR